MASAENKRGSRQRRYFVRRDLHVDVSIHRKNSSPAVTGGRLLEISVGGARVVLPQPVQFDEKIVLQVFCEQNELDLRFPSTARWIRRTRDDVQFAVGCIFDEELSQAQLDLFVERGVFSRREHMRYPVTLSARVRCELGGKESEVELYDVSKGGISLVSAAPVSVGARIQLLVDEPSAQFRFLGQICWQEKIDGGYLVGCRILDTKASNMVVELLQLYNSIVRDAQTQQAVNDLMKETAPEKKAPRRRRLFRWRAC